jgi:hypothetical protein
MDAVWLECAYAGIEAQLSDRALLAAPQALNGTKRRAVVEPKIS